MKHKKIISFLLTIALVLVIAVIAFWDTLVIYYAPKTILSVALSEAVSQLQSRFAGDPMVTVLKTLDPEGKQTALLELTAADPYLGEVCYDMQLDLEPHRVQAKGNVTTRRTQLDLALYADTDFMAVSSEGLVSGAYYGITYDTFDRDIRSIPLLTWVISEPMLQSWNHSVLNIQKQMEIGYPVWHMPVLSAEDLKSLLLQLILVPADVERTTISLQNTSMDCYRIRYRVSGNQVADLLRQYMDIGNSDSATVTADFFLYERSIVAIDLNIHADDLKRGVRMEFGQDVLHDPITAVITQEAEGNQEQISVRIDTRPGTNGHFCESWQIDRGIESGLELYYDWDPATGDMLLTVGDSEEISLNLTETENGIQLKSDDISALVLALFPQDPTSDTSRKMSGSIIVQRGSAVSTPEYINLDQWSLDDFLILLEGVGNLLGLGFH